jgi:hypothetical protein
MTPLPPTLVLIVGADATGMITAHELARARPMRRTRLPAAGRGIWISGGEFVHGAAPVIRALMRGAGLSLSPIGGTHWSVRRGAFSRDEAPPPHAGRLYQALRQLKIDLPIAEFLETHFADQRYSELRRTITGMVEGYDAADLRPSRSIVPKTAAAGSAAGPCDRAGAIPRSAADGNSTNSALTQGSAPRCLVECP